MVLEEPEPTREIRQGQLVPVGPGVCRAALLPCGIVGLRQRILPKDPLGSLAVGSQAGRGGWRVEGRWIVLIGMPHFFATLSLVSSNHVLVLPKQLRFLPLLEELQLCGEVPRMASEKEWAPRG